MRGEQPTEYKSPFERFRGRNMKRFVTGLLLSLGLHVGAGIGVRTVGNERQTKLLEKRMQDETEHKYEQKKHDRESVKEFLFLPLSKEELIDDLLKQMGVKNIEEVKQNTELTKKIDLGLYFLQVEFLEDKITAKEARDAYLNYLLKLKTFEELKEKNPDPLYIAQEVMKEIKKPQIYAIKTHKKRGNNFDYNPTSPRLSQLLLNGTSSCESRSKFTTAILSSLFPALPVKLQLYAPDTKGIGHVQTIIEFQSKHYNVQTGIHVQELEEAEVEGTTIFQDARIAHLGLLGIYSEISIINEQNNNTILDKKYGEPNTELIQDIKEERTSTDNYSYPSDSKPTKTFKGSSEPGDSFASEYDPDLLKNKVHTNEHQAPPRPSQQKKGGFPAKPLEKSIEVAREKLAKELTGKAVKNTSSLHRAAEIITTPTISIERQVEEKLGINKNTDFQTEEQTKSEPHKLHARYIITQMILPRLVQEEENQKEGVADPSLNDPIMQAIKKIDEAGELDRAITYWQKGWMEYTEKEILQPPIKNKKTGSKYFKTQSRIAERILEKIEAYKKLSKENRLDRVIGFFAIKKVIALDINTPISPEDLLQDLKTLFIKVDEFLINEPDFTFTISINHHTSNSLTEESIELLSKIPLQKIFLDTNVDLYKIRKLLDLQKKKYPHKEVVMVIANHKEGTDITPIVSHLLPNHENLLLYRDKNIEDFLYINDTHKIDIAQTPEEKRQLGDTYIIDSTLNRIVTEERLVIDMTGFPNIPFKVELYDKIVKKINRFGFSFDDISIAFFNDYKTVVDKLDKKILEKVKKVTIKHTNTPISLPELLEFFPNANQITIENSSISNWPQQVTSKTRKINFEIENCKLPENEFPPVSSSTMWDITLVATDIIQASTYINHFYTLNNNTVSVTMDEEWFTLRFEYNYLNFKLPDYSQIGRILQASEINELHLIVHGYTKKTIEQITVLKKYGIEISSDLGH